MRTVHIYAECNTRNVRKAKRRTMYLLELTDSLGKGLTSRWDILEEEATYYEAVLHAFIRAAERLKKNEACRLIFHSGNMVLLNALESLSQTAEAGFTDKKGKPVNHAKEWEYLYHILERHDVGICEGEHTYYKWMINNLQISEKTSRILG